MSNPLAHRGKHDHQDHHCQDQRMEEYEPNSRAMGLGARTLGRDPAKSDWHLRRWAPAPSSDRPGRGDSPRKTGAPERFSPAVYGEAGSFCFGGPSPRGCRSSCLGAKGGIREVPRCLPAIVIPPALGGS